MVSQKMEQEMKNAGQALKDQALRTAQEMQTKVEEKVSNRIEAMEKKIAKLDQVASTVEQLTAHSKETVAAVKDLQRAQQEVQPFILAKVEEATEKAANTLSVALEAKLDSLGSRLLQQVASMAKKRDNGDERRLYTESSSRCWRRQKRTETSSRHPRAT